MRTQITAPVKIRFRNTNDGGKSIFLDYALNGKRKFEFLKLYLLPGKGKVVKAHNDNVMLMAQARKGQRLQDLQDDIRMSELSAPQGSSVRFCEYVEQLCEKENITEKTKKAYRNMARFVKEFYTDRMTFRKIDRNFLKDFILRLIDYTPVYHYKSKKGKRLGNNIMVAVYSVLRSVIGKAYRDGILPSNPTEEFKVSDYVKGTETERAYLELEELKKFAAVETRHLLEKQAFVFSCICGLRVSDVRKLTWGDIKKVGDDYKIEIRQKKTRDRLSNPLSPEILHWLPERSDEVSSSDIVFPLVAEQYVNDKIREIAKEAGIHKHLSFHSARHTCATMMLTLGVDLYTVSKLLGHRRVITTQIYGNIVDKKKREAVDMIPDFMQ